MVYAHPSICPRKSDAKNPLGLWHKNGSPHPGPTTRPYNNKQKREVAELWTLPYRLTTEYNWKKAKRSISTSTFLGIEKTVEHESNDYSNCNWGLGINWGTWNYQDEWRPAKLLYYWDQPEYTIDYYFTYLRFIHMSVSWWFFISLRDSKSSQVSMTLFSILADLNYAIDPMASTPCANLLHSLIMWLIVSSLTSHNLHLLFCCVLSILALMWLVLMAFFCTFARRESISLWKFPYYMCNH